MTSNSTSLKLNYSRKLINTDNIPTVILSALLSFRVSVANRVIDEVAEANAKEIYIPNL